MIVGIDEAGRGPLAGPVVAGAVILDPQYEIMGLMDSKQLTTKKREQLALQIKEKALAWGVGEASVEEIDQHNIFQATFLAMQRAFEALMKLNITPQQALIDGKYSPTLPIPTQAVIKGDQKVPCISAASILAKVTRDALMKKLDLIYPEYGLAQHKGYGTQKHLIALKMYGYTPCHRVSFAPVRQCVQREGS